MSLENAILSQPLREKLRNLQEYISGEERVIYQLAGFLADRIKPSSQITPIDFLLAAELAIIDLERGINGFSGQPITNGLTGLPPMIYSAFRAKIPAIATAVSPREFSAEVERHYQRAILYQEMKRHNN